jgi:hypothetical protein
VIPVHCFSLQPWPWIGPCQDRADLDMQSATAAGGRQTEGTAAGLNPAIPYESLAQGRHSMKTLMFLA